MAETKTGWTSEWYKLANGVYWWRFDEKETPVAVRVFKSLVYGFVEDQGRRLNTYGGEFLGPISPSDAEQLSELRKALECAVTRLEDNERWWHQARTLTTLTAFEKQAFEARAQTTRTTLDQLRAVLSPAKKAANT